MSRFNEMPMNPLSLSRFTHHKERKTLAAEASDFGPCREGTWWLQQIWNDACDIGIAIRSEKTNRVERFYLEREEVRDGDLMYWQFKPVSQNLDLTVIIFND